MKPNSRSESRWKSNYLGGTHTKRGYIAFQGSRKLCKDKMRKARRQTDKKELLDELEKKLLEKLEVLETPLREEGDA